MDISNMNVNNNAFVQNQLFSYEKSVYEPQDLLATWLLVSFFFVTTSLLFYHMTRERLVKYPWFAAGFALFLMFISLTIIISSLVIYNKRMNNILEKCKHYGKNICSEEEYNNINFLKNIYTYASILIILSKSLVVYFLIFHMYKYL